MVAQTQILASLPREAAQGPGDEDEDGVPPLDRVVDCEAMDWFNANFYKDYGHGLVYPQLFHKRPTEELQAGTIAWGKDKSRRWLKVLDEHLLGRTSRTSILRRRATRSISPARRAARPADRLPPWRTAWSRSRSARSSSLSTSC